MCALCWTRQASACEFGTLPTVPPCARAECKVCSICQSSFHLREVGAGSGGRGWAGKLRYGDGLYFAPNSSKSNDYNEKSQRERKSGAGEVRRWRCMFLSTVALGRSFSPTEDQMSPDECEALGNERLVRWRKAAEEGDSESIAHLGFAYDFGYCRLAKDDASAALWYKRAADLGLAEAQFNLGNAYRDGKGVVQDLAESLRRRSKGRRNAL